MNRTLHGFFACAFLLTVAAGPARAQGPGGQPPDPVQMWKQFEKELDLQTTYSVDITMEMMGMSLVSHSARKGDLNRTEMTLPMMNLKMVALEIPEGGQKASYSLFPETKKYVRNDEDPQARARARAAANFTGTPKIEDLGTEAFEGVDCRKRRITLSQGGMTTEMIMLCSPAAKNMPVKMILNASVPTVPGRPPMPVQSTMLFRNYDFSAPADSLFAIPADYAKAASMQQIMMESMDLGAMMQQLQQQPAPAAP